MHSFSGPMLGNCPFLLINVVYLISVKSHNTDAHINGCTLPVVTHTRDLGVIVSSDLSPSVHITDIVSKAHQRAGLILRTFISRDIHLLCVLSWFMCVLLSNITQSFGHP